MKINVKFIYKMVIEQEHLMRQLGEGEQYMREIVSDEERACNWLNGKEIKEVLSYLMRRWLASWQDWSPK